MFQNWIKFVVDAFYCIINETSTLKYSQDYLNTDTLSWEQSRQHLYSIMSRFMDKYLNSTPSTFCYSDITLLIGCHTLFKLKGTVYNNSTHCYSKIIESLEISMWQTNTLMKCSQWVATLTVSHLYPTRNVLSIDDTHE